ncbi:hypothetical protein HGB44_09165 [Nocardiopsis dassonvillei subsp. albirubida]|uniref:DUF4386 family protein n=1 Tax=Nocardiopsis alborubida TaxID=146802 RepID=A0A7X6MDW7_9ACTN|nr:hypothetical protein [Nocardiopsis alborubida]
MFGAGAVAATWRSERERGEAWALVGFAGLVLQNTTFAGIVALRLALASMPLDEPAVTAAVWAVHEGFFTLNGTFLALALLGLSVAGRRGGLIRPWHAALGLVSAALMLASSVLAPLVIEHGNPLGLIGLVGWLLWVVWVCAYGVVLVRLPSLRAPAAV